MINLQDLTVWIDISHRLMQITDAQIAAAERRVDTKRRPSEVTLGVIESHTTRALYALGRLYAAEQERATADAKACDDETTEKDLSEKAAMLDMYEDVTKELFWAQAKLDIGFHEIANVGIRRGWLVVKLPSTGPAGILSALLQGGPPE